MLKEAVERKRKTYRAALLGSQHDPNSSIHISQGTPRPSIAQDKPTQPDPQCQYGQEKRTDPYMQMSAMVRNLESRLRALEARPEAPSFEDLSETLLKAIQTQLSLIVPSLVVATLEAHQKSLRE